MKYIQTESSILRGLEQLKHPYSVDVQWEKLGNWSYFSGLH